VGLAAALPPTIGIRRYWSSGAPASRRPQAHRRARRQRNPADLEAAARRHPGQGIRPSLGICQKLLGRGSYTSVSAIGEAENISKSYVSRIRRLALLASHMLSRSLIDLQARSNATCRA
jgi:hypothetical protein